MKLTFLTLSLLYRQEKRRDGCCCCCIALPDNYRESSFAKRDLLKECMNKYIGPVMLSLPGKVNMKSDVDLSLILGPSILLSFARSWFDRFFFRWAFDCSSLCLFVSGLLRHFAGFCPKLWCQGGEFSCTWEGRIILQWVWLPSVEVFSKIRDGSFENLFGGMGNSRSERLVLNQIFHTEFFIVRSHAWFFFLLMGSWW